MVAYTKSKPHSSYAPFSCLSTLWTSLEHTFGHLPLLENFSTCPLLKVVTGFEFGSTLHKMIVFQASLFSALCHTDAQYLSSSVPKVISSGNYKGRVLNALIQIVILDWKHYLFHLYRLPSWKVSLLCICEVSQSLVWRQRGIDIFHFPILTLRRSQPIHRSQGKPPKGCLELIVTWKVCIYF